MQTQQLDKIKQVLFVGSHDPSIWLEDKNGDHTPLLIPLWPADYPRHVAVYLCESGELGIALSRGAMLEACHSLLQKAPTLWFCNIPLDEFQAATNANSVMYS